MKRRMVSSRWRESGENVRGIRGKSRMRCFSCSVLVMGRIVSYGSIGLLLLLTFIIVNPSTESGSYATCLDGVGDNECAVSSLSQEVGVTSRTAISLATSNKVQLPDVTPISTGATSYASTKLAVSTNSKEGYSIFLQTGTAEGDLTGVTSSMDEMSKITNTAQTGALLSNLETNSYGYALSTAVINDNTTYSHVPTSSTMIHNQPGSASMGSGAGDYPYGDEYYLAFGTKIGTSLPAGTYAGTVTVSAIANPLTVTSLYDITTMQDMTSSICENTREGYTKQLIDIRDGKSYWVAKLKDGNCWMVQNLALDVDVDNDGYAVAVSESGTTQRLTAENTDLDLKDMNGEWKTIDIDGAQINVTNGWTNEQTGDGRKIVAEDNPYDLWEPKATIRELKSTRMTHGVAWVWNLGKYVVAMPMIGATECEDTSDQSACLAANDINVEGWQPTFRVSAAKADIALPDSDLVVGTGKLITLDLAAKTYDPHYLIGNWYSYGAATAGSGMDIGDANATASVCPKGWKLALAGAGHYGTINNVGMDGSFQKLGQAYRNDLTGDIIVSNPMYFIVGGLIRSYDGKWTNRNVGSYISATSLTKWYDGSDMNAASVFSVSAIRTNVAGGQWDGGANYSGNGFSMRCWAAGD